MDRQSIAYRESGPLDWWTGDIPPIPDSLPIHPPEWWDAHGWDADALAAKSVAEARELLTARVLDPTAPDDDVTAYDELVRQLGDATPRTAGRPLGAASLFVPWLPDAARSTGYPVVLVPGWATRGHGGMRVVEGVVGHHTAGSKSGEMPSLAVVRDGRAGLAGPLCNLALGRSGTIYVVAAGCGWHAGASRHAGFVDLNDEFLGIEAEDDGDGTWTPAQLDAYPKLVGALLRYMNRGPDRYVSHRSCAIPAGRKPDPAGIDDAWMRSRAAAFIGGGAAPAPTGGDVHTVARGDTLYALARRYGVTVANLRAWNGLTSDTLSIGQRIRVKPAAPAPAPTGGDVHTVARGDTLYALARRYGVTVANLRAWNGLTSDTLSIGQRIRVKPAAPAPAPAPAGPLVLRYGMTHPDVRRLQSILTARYPAYAKWSPVTDYFGDLTLAAVKEFQRRSGLVADGIVGAATRARLGM